VGKRFFKYPKSLQTVALSGLGVRSGDGLAIAVDVAFTYRIASSIDDLIKLYLSFGEVNEVGRLYQRIAESAVRDAAAKFSAFAFITNRTAVATEMGKWPVPHPPRLRRPLQHHVLYRTAAE